MNIGKAMKEIREERKLSSWDVATQLGITPSALWRIENGKVWPKKSTVDRFCFVLKLQPARLILRSISEEDFLPDWAKPALIIQNEPIPPAIGDAPVMLYGMSGTTAE